MPRSRPTLLTCAALLAAPCLASCGDEPVATRHGPMTYTTNPSALSLRVGDTTTAGMSVAREVPAPTIAWATSAPEVFVITAVNPAGTRVGVRAMGRGAADLRFTVAVDGQTITGSIPVAVSGAP